nr:MAG TPA: hypothetical protein [Caudoviricetes sp.]
MLTTEDNPFNPWTQYELWRRWDIDHGYNLESYIDVNDRGQSIQSLDSV